MKKTITIGILLAVTFAFLMPIQVSARTYTFTADRIREASFPVIPTDVGQSVRLLASRRDFDHIGNFISVLEHLERKLGSVVLLGDNSDSGVHIMEYSYGYNPSEAGDMKFMLPDGTVIDIKLTEPSTGYVGDPKTTGETDGTIEFQDGVDIIL